MPRRPVNSDRCPNFNIMVLQTVYGRFGRGWQAHRMYILKHAATKSFARSRAIPNCQCGPRAAYRCPVPAALEYRCGGPRPHQSRSAKTAFPGRIPVPVPRFAGSLTTPTSSSFRFRWRYQARRFRSCDAMQLSIHNSGCAFDSDTAIKGGGLGLISYERIKLVNGALSIDSQINPGTSIHARVPCNPGE